MGANLSSWQTWAAPLGFGFTGVATNIDVPPPTSNRPLAAYFVRTFQVANPAAVVSLTLNTVSDDGVIVHVNGVEVARENVQAGTNTHGLYALSPYRTNVAPPVVIEVPTSLLVAGTNVVAVSTHVNWRATPDISFDLDAQLTTATGEGAPNQVPVAVIDDVVSSGLAVSVGGSGSFDPDGSIVSYVWDFGDGSDEVSGATASYTYAEAGTYSVTLTVTDNRGATGSVNASVTVAESGEPVTSTVIERGAVWSWYYAAAAPQANWRELGANLSSWQTGAAPSS